MKGIIATVTGIAMMLVLFINAACYATIITNKNISSDSLKHAVIFSIDDFKPSGGKNTGLHFYYLDSLAHSQMPNISARENKVTLYTPTIFIEANALQTPFLVYPGEQVNIKYSGSDSTQMYIRGNPNRTNELLFFRKLIQKTGNMYYGFTFMPYHKKVNTLQSIRDLEKTINNVKNTRLRFLKSYSGQFQVSEDFIKIAQNCISSTAITDSLLLYYSNRILLTQQNLYKSVVASKITGLNKLKFMPHPMYDVACLGFVAMAIGDAPYGAISGTRNSFIKRFNVIKETFTGVAKDFLLANALYAASLNRVPLAKSDLNNFNEQCTDNGYRALIARKLNDNDKSIRYAKGSNKLLSFDGKAVQDLSAVVKKHKGKLILFDFWASWCGPCRAEMPYSLSLKKKYEGKNIVFLAISTDANINDWQKAAKEQALEKDYSFLLLNSDQASFVKHYQINAIPRYLLIGKDGNMLNDDAPRPSDAKLKVLIDHHL